MNGQALLMLDAQYFVFGLNADGTLTQSACRLDRPPSFETLTADEPIRQFCVVAKDGHFHVLAATAGGVHVLKSDCDGKRTRQKLRIASHAKAAHPFLFFSKSVMHLCYLLSENGIDKLIIKSYKDGAWKENTLLEEAIRIEEVKYAAGHDDTLHVLYRQTNGRGEQALGYLRYDLQAGTARTDRLFVAKHPQSRWKCSIGLDPRGVPHVSWTLWNGTNVAYYYASERHSSGSALPLFLTVDENLASPHFLFAGDFVLLLFWNGKRSMTYLYSFDRGQTWSASHDLQFQTHSPLYLLQTMSEGPKNVIAPVSALGLGLPFFRPLEWIDFFNPFVWIKAKSSLDMLGWAMGRMEQFRSDFMEHASRIQQEVHELSMQNEEYRSLLRQFQEEYTRLETEENKALDRLRLLKMAHSRNLFSSPS